MARILLQDGTDVKVTREIGEMYWDILQGNTNDYPEGAVAKVEKVKSVYLNWRNETTPTSYVEAHWSVLKDKVQSEWLVDVNGRPTRPYERDTRIMALSKEYGLIDGMGNATWEGKGGRPL